MKALSCFTEYRIASLFHYNSYTSGYTYIALKVTKAVYISISMTLSHLSLRCYNWKLQFVNLDLWQEQLEQVWFIVGTYRNHKQVIDQEKNLIFVV